MSEETKNKGIIEYAMLFPVYYPLGTKYEIGMSQDREKDERYFRYAERKGYWISEEHYDNLLKDRDKGIGMTKEEESDICKRLMDIHKGYEDVIAKYKEISSKQITKIYAIMQGESHEDTCIVKVCSSLELARKEAEAIRTSDLDEDDESTLWLVHSEDTWCRNDDEYMTIEEHEVN